MKVLPIAYQKQWGVNYSINDKRRDFMSDNNKKVEEKAAEIIQATETQTVKPAAAEDKEFKKKKSTTWERNQRKWGWAFILPTMIGIIVLNLWPYSTDDISVILQGRFIRRFIICRICKLQEDVC